MSFYITTSLGILTVLFSVLPPHISKPIFAETSRVILDMAGHPTHLEEPAQKVMIFAPMLWHYVNVDDSDAHVFAIAKFMKTEAQHTLFGKIFPNLAIKDEALTSSGAIPLSVEQILLERPDAVITWAMFAQGLENIYYPGLVKINTDQSEANITLYRLFGELSGKQQRVDWLIERYYQQVSEIKQNLPANANKQTVVVLDSEQLILVRVHESGFNTQLNSLNAISATTKLKRINGDTNIETLLSLDPDIIFLISFYKSTFAPADIYADPRLQTLLAVKNRRVYRMLAGASRMEGPIESPLLMAWMVELLHPEIKPAIHVRERISTTYQEVYAYTMSESEINAMLQIEVNKISAEYERFNAP